MSSDPFVIDLRDEADLTIKHRLAKAELADAERKAAKWRQVVEFVASQLPEVPSASESVEDAIRAAARAGAASAAETATHGAVIAEAVEAVVNRQDRPIQSLEVREILEREGHELSAASVYNSLRYVALRAKRIQQLPGRGVFAPLSYRPDANGSAATQVSPQTQLTPGGSGDVG